MSKQPEAHTTPENETPLYSVSFFSDQFRSSRKLLISVFVLPIIYTSLLFCACLGLYYGSIISTNNVSRLTLYAVDLDGGFLGQQIIGGINTSERSANGPEWRLDLSITSTEMSQQLVLDEHAWVVLQVSANASANLETALSTGNVSYDPLSAISLIYASARNQLTSSILLPAILAVLNPIVSDTAVQHAAAFFGAAAGNESVINTAMKCPQCVAAPFAIHQLDLRPFNNPTGSLPTQVGQIFLLTFAYSVFLILRASAVVMGAQLDIRSTLILRTVLALSSYFLFGLWYTLMAYAFGVPMHYVAGRGGFVVFWMLNTCAMGAVGLPMESLHTIIGLDLSGYFLNLWIYVNVAGSFYSFQLMPNFFKYGYALPFYNSIQGTRSIISGTKVNLGQNFGVLLAWNAVGLIGMLGFTAINVRRNRRTGAHVLP